MFSKSKSRRRRSPHRNRRDQNLAFEVLEPRQLLATYSGAGGPIDDNAQTDFTLVVPTSTTIADLDVQVDIQHSRDADLDVYLVSPTGTRVELFTDVGGGGDDFDNTVLDDEASISITAGSAPFAGSYQPEGTLSDFDGEDASGTWTLEITDDQNRKTGSLNSWSITTLAAGPPSLSISDVNVTEGASLAAFVDAVVDRGSGGLDGPIGMILGSDNNLYVTSANTDEVLRYDASTGAFIDVFVSAGDGGLDNPKALAFGNGGNLYVSSTATNEVLQYDGLTGGFQSVFVENNSGGLSTPRGIAFGPDGNLYVVSRGTDEILRFDGTNGDFVDAFVSAGSGGLGQPVALTFGPDGNLYVTSVQTDEVLRFEGPGGGTPGAFLDVYVSINSSGLDNPHELIFGPNDNLYVTSTGNDDRVLLFQGPDALAPGAIIGEFVSAKLGGLDGPRGMVFNSAGELLVSSLANDQILRYSQGLVVNLSAPSSTVVTVDFTSTDGTALGGIGYSESSGTLKFEPGETTKRLLAIAFDDVDVETAKTFEINLSNASSGISISDATGVVTIQDDESTRQFSIDDVVITEGDTTPHYLGNFVDGVPGGHFNPFTFGPDGYIYTAVGTGPGYNTVQRYDSVTGNYVDTFIDNSGGEINGVRDILFHPTDGLIYIASSYTDEVLRYDQVTGDFVDVFVTANSGGIDHPDGMMWGPDYNNDGVAELYVTGWLSDDVVRYDGVTGAPLGTYISPNSGGLNEPFSLAFRNDEVFVVSANTHQILKYDAMTGAFLGVVVDSELNYPRGLTFGPDDLLYVASGNGNRVVRFTPDGTFVDEFASDIPNPRTPRFGPDGNLYLTATYVNGIMRFGENPEAVLTVSLSSPSNLPITVDFSTADGSAVAGTDYSATSGTVTFAPGITTKTIVIATIDDAVEESNESYYVNLSNAVGGVIVDNQGEATIADDDGTSMPTILFSDSFENGEWNGLWSEDGQNDWFTSSQRATDGSQSAEVDGNASDATLTVASPIDLSSYASAELTFDWLIENGFDYGDYVALDFWNGSSWIEVDRLSGIFGSQDPENTWHSETIAVDPQFMNSDFQFRYRANVDRSNEDANVDNVKLTGNEAAARGTGGDDRSNLAAYWAQTTLKSHWSQATVNAWNQGFPYDQQIQPLPGFVSTQVDHSINPFEVRDEHKSSILAKRLEPITQVDFDVTDQLFEESELFDFDSDWK